MQGSRQLQHVEDSKCAKGTREHMPQPLRPWPAGSTCLQTDHHIAPGRAKAGKGGQTVNIKIVEPL